MNKLMLSSVVLLLLTNVVVLSGVAYNRSGEPLLSLELTERELPVVYSYISTDENSGTALSLDWRVLNTRDNFDHLYNNYGTPVWLTDEKLTGLGFDLDKLKNNKEAYQYNRDALKAEVVLVMEYQGETYQQALVWGEAKTDELRHRLLLNPDDKELISQLKRYEKRLTELKVALPRLYVIDAGLNKQDLMQKYKDSDNYLFMLGEVGVGWDDDDIVGNIQQLHIQQVHVPLPYSQLLTSLTNGERYYRYGKEPVPPRYKIQLNIGKRLEPWIGSVQPNEETQ